MFFQLKQNEKIILSLRRHWLVLALILFRVLPLFIVPWLAWFFLSFRFDMTEHLAQQLFWLISSLWWLFLWGGLAVLWINYYLDFWIVTSQRIISTYQNGLFRQEVSELSLSRIQDLTVNVRGILKTFVNYGNLEIRTAGTFEGSHQPDGNVNVFVFRDIPRPYEVQNVLSKIRQDFIKASGWRA